MFVTEFKVLDVITSSYNKKNGDVVKFNNVVCELPVVTDYEKFVTMQDFNSNRSYEIGKSYKITWKISSIGSEYNGILRFYTKATIVNVEDIAVISVQQQFQQPVVANPNGPTTYVPGRQQTIPQQQVPQVQQPIQQPTTRAYVPQQQTQVPIIDPHLNVPIEDDDLPF